MGAILANVITTEFIILLTCFLFLTVGGIDYQKALPALFILAVFFPLAFFHHSWSFWLAFDYLVESLPKYDERRKF